MTERQKASEVSEPLNDDKWKVHWWGDWMRLMLPADRHLDRVEHCRNGTIKITITIKPDAIAESSTK